MSFDADEEILQDFLVEAGEILELLSEQLVDLEQRPQDKDLLNAIFRGFHTVKGGAGFLQLSPLVDCCHAAENVFDTLRNGKRSVTSDLMDVVLQALDSVNEMFDAVRSGATPDNADPELIERLHQLAKPASEDDVAADDVVAVDSEETADLTETAAPAPVDDGDITDDEFERLLDALDEQHQHQQPADDGAAAAEAGSSGADSDEITDDEFEALLDQLHGKGRHTGVAAEAAPAAEPV